MSRVRGTSMPCGPGATGAGHARSGWIREANGPPTPMQARDLAGVAPAEGSMCRPTWSSTPSSGSSRQQRCLPVYGGVTGWAVLALAGGVWFDGLTSAWSGGLPVTSRRRRLDDQLAADRRVGGDDRARSTLTVLDGVPVTSTLRAVVSSCDTPPTSARPSGASGWRRTPTWSRSTRWPPTPGCGRAPVFRRGSDPAVPQRRSLADENCWSPPRVRDGDLRARCGTAAAVVQPPGLRPLR